MICTGGATGAESGRAHRRAASAGPARAEATARSGRPGQLVATFVDTRTETDSFTPRVHSTTWAPLRRAMSAARAQASVRPAWRAPAPARAARSAAVRARCVAVAAAPRWSPAVVRTRSTPMEATASTVPEPRSRSRRRRPSDDVAPRRARASLGAPSGRTAEQALSRGPGLTGLPRGLRGQCPGDER
jgi:hypothetical protein